MNPGGITEWVLANLVPVILLFIGLGILFVAKKGKYSDVLGTLGIVIIGLVVIAGAAGIRAMADDIANTAFNDNGGGGGGNNQRR